MKNKIITQPQPFLTRTLSKLSLLSMRNHFLTLCLAACALSAGGLSHAATVTWTGGLAGTGTTYDTATNWSGNALPTATDEALFDNSFGGTYATVPPNSNALTTTSSMTWGSVVWNSNDSGGIALTGATNRTLSLSGSGGNSAAIAAGGAAGDLITVGTAKTSGTFTLNNSNGTGSGRLTLKFLVSGNIDVVNANATLVLGAQLSGPSAIYTLTKTGAGTLILNNGNNNPAGLAGSKFVLDAGTVNFSSSSGIGNTNNTLEIHGGTFLDNSSGSLITFTNNNAQNWTGDFTYKGASSLITGTGAVTETGGTRTVTVSTAGVSLSVGGIGDGGNSYGLIKAGAGVLSIAGTSSYGGDTAINAGQITIGVTNALPVATNLTINSGTLQLNGKSQTLATINGSASATVIASSGTSTLTVNGSADSLFAGAIKNGASPITTNLIKAGTGTLTLTGTSTYTGATTVNGGRLIVSGSLTASVVTVNGDANTTLGGNGGTSLLTTITAGRVAPGLNISGANNNFGTAGTLRLGTTAVTGGLTLTDAKLDFDLASTNGAGLSDQIVTGGPLALSSTITFTFNELSLGVLQEGVAYTLISGATGNSGFDATALASLATVLNGDYTPTFSMSGNNLQVTFAAVPEPGTWAMMLGGLGILVTAQKMRRRSIKG